MATQLLRYRINWIGDIVGPAVTTLFVDASGANINAVGDTIDTFFSGIGPYVPSGVSFQRQAAVDTLDATTGQLVATGADTRGPHTTNATGSGNYAAGVGTMVTWDAQTIVNGKRLKGRTFIVPINSGLYTASGVISGTAQSAFQTAANQMVTALGTSGPALQVWHRPVGGGGGSAHDVQAATVAGKTQWLLTRRT